MSNLSVFQFESNNVRVLMVDNEPWFVAKDICEILEVRNVSDALDRLDSDEKNTIVLSDGNRGNPNTAIISESGMYALVLSSRKPEAKPFRKWVTSEVLLSLRKTGTYSLPSAPTATKPGCLLAYEERVLQLPQKLKVPEGYWTVLEESAYLLLHIEQVLKVPVNHSDLLDGSIGKMWSAHRKDKDWTRPIKLCKYQYPDGRWCNPNAYEWSELGYFRGFMKQDYTHTHLPKYLDRKYPGLVKFGG